jgi:hypothetical protein
MQSRCRRKDMPYGEILPRSPWRSLHRAKIGAKCDWRTQPETREAEIRGNKRGRYDALMQAVISQAQTVGAKAKGCPPRRPDGSSLTRSSEAASHSLYRRPRRCDYHSPRSVRLRPHAGQPARRPSQTPPPQSPADAVSERRSFRSACSVQDSGASTIWSNGSSLSMTGEAHDRE